MRSTWLALGWLASVGLCACGAEGSDAADGSTAAAACTIAMDPDGVARLSCADGTQYELPRAPDAGVVTCNVARTDAGTTVECADGTRIELPAPAEPREPDAPAEPREPDAPAEPREPDAPADPEPCVAEDNGDGTSTLSCPDGSSVTLANAGASTECTVISETDGARTVQCSDGTSVTLEPAVAPSECTLTPQNDGTSLIECSGGASAVIPTNSSGSGSLPVLVEFAELGFPDVCLGSTGIELRVGLDHDGDSVLDASEIDSRHFVCGEVTAGNLDALCGSASLGDGRWLPQPGSSRVPVDSVVRLNYGAPFEISSFTLTRVGDATAVAGDLGVLPDQSILQFDPSAALAPGADYEVSVSLDGPCGADQRTWSFTTDPLGLPLTSEAALVGRSFVIDLHLGGSQGESSERLTLQVLDLDVPGTNAPKELSLRFGLTSGDTQDRCVPTTDVVADFSDSPHFVTATMPSLWIDAGNFRQIEITGATLELTFHPDGLSAAAGTLSGTVDLDDLATVESFDVLELCQLVESLYGSVCDPDNRALLPFGVPIARLAQGLSLAAVGTAALDVDADHDGSRSQLCGGGDCDDSDPLVYPGKPEICGDSIDNDCDGAVDFIDADLDGFASASCGGLDCDDDAPFVNPDATDYCNGVDDDCDGSENACVAPDREYCPGAEPIVFSGPSTAISGTLASAADDLGTGCFDPTSVSGADHFYAFTIDHLSELRALPSAGNPMISVLPSTCVAAPVACLNLGGGESSMWLYPASYVLQVETRDGAAYGVELTVTVLDGDDDGFTLYEDCDDANPNVNPLALEVCNDNLDNDCDWHIDEPDDLDFDGHPSAVCGGNDCDDGNFYVNPDAGEDCFDTIDNNCDLLIDAQDPLCPP